MMIHLIVRRLPCELNISCTSTTADSCTSTTAESRARFGTSKMHLAPPPPPPPPDGLGCCPFYGGGSVVVDLFKK